MIPTITQQSRAELDDFILSSSLEEQNRPSFMQAAQFDFQTIGNDKKTVEELAGDIHNDFERRKGRLDRVIVKIAGYWIFPIATIANTVLSVSSLVLKSRVSFLKPPRTYAIYAAAFLVISGVLSYFYDWLLSRSENELIKEWRMKDGAEMVYNWHDYFDPNKDNRFEELHNRCQELARMGIHNKNQKFITFVDRIDKLNRKIQENKSRFKLLPEIAQKVLKG